MAAQGLAEERQRALEQSRAAALDAEKRAADASERLAAELAAEHEGRAATLEGHLAEHKKEAREAQAQAIELKA